MKTDKCGGYCNPATGKCYECGQDALVCLSIGRQARGLLDGFSVNQIHVVDGQTFVHENDALSAIAAAIRQSQTGETKMSADGKLFNKFNVTRNDGTDAPGEKHEGCKYFVLDVTHDPHAIAALGAYANAAEATHPELAADMREQYGLGRQPVQSDDVRHTHTAECPHWPEKCNCTPVQAAPDDVSIADTMIREALQYVGESPEGSLLHVAERLKMYAGNAHIKLNTVQAMDDAFVRRVADAMTAFGWATGGDSEDFLDDVSASINVAKAATLAKKSPA